jgi:hypothetical protein
MKDDMSFQPADEHDIVIATWLVFDEGDERASRREMLFCAPLISAERLCDPSTPPYCVSEDAAPDTGATHVEQRGKVLRKNVSLAPVPQHHCRSGAAAELFALGEKRHIEEGEGLQRRDVGACGVWQQEPRGEEQRRADPAFTHPTGRPQWTATMIRMRRSRPMIMVVVEIVTFDWPPANESSTARACAAQQSGEAQCHRASRLRTPRA